MNFEIVSLEVDEDGISTATAKHNGKLIEAELRLHDEMITVCYDGKESRPMKPNLLPDDVVVRTLWSEILRGQGRENRATE